MAHTLKLLGELLAPDATTAALDPAFIARFIATRPESQSDNTTISQLGRIRSLCSYAVSQGYLRTSPFAYRKTWLRRVPVVRRQHHSIQDLARCLWVARSDIDRKVQGSHSQWRARRTYVMLAIFAYTGLRRNEGLYLRVEDIDLNGRMILVVSRTSNRLKTIASEQPVPMPNALVSIVADWLPYLAITEPAPDRDADPGWLIPNARRTAPWTGGSPGYKPLCRLRRLGVRAKCEGPLTFQSLRHSYATHGAVFGLSESTVQRVLRHTSSRTTHGYMHPDLVNLRDAVKDIDFGTDAPAPPAANVPVAPSEPLHDTGAPLPPLPAPGRPYCKKLDLADAREARELRARGWSLRALADRYKVAKSTIHYCLTNTTHREP
jgi:integrase